MRDCGTQTSLTIKSQTLISIFRAETVDLNDSNVDLIWSDCTTSIDGIKSLLPTTLQSVSSIHSENPFTPIRPVRSISPTNRMLLQSPGLSPIVLVAAETIADSKNDMLQLKADDTFNDYVSSDDDDDDSISNLKSLKAECDVSAAPRGKLFTDSESDKRTELLSKKSVVVSHSQTTLQPMHNSKCDDNNESFMSLRAMSLLPDTPPRVSTKNFEDSPFMSPHKSESTTVNASPPYKLHATPLRGIIKGSDHYREAHDDNIAQALSERQRDREKNNQLIYNIQRKYGKLSVGDQFVSPAKENSFLADTPSQTYADDDEVLLRANTARNTTPSKRPSDMYRVGTTSQLPTADSSIFDDISYLDSHMPEQSFPRAVEAARHQSSLSPAESTAGLALGATYKLSLSPTGVPVFVPVSTTQQLESHTLSSGYEKTYMSNGLRYPNHFGGSTQHQSNLMNKHNVYANSGVNRAQDDSYVMYSDSPSMLSYLPDTPQSTGKVRQRSTAAVHYRYQQQQQQQRWTDSRVNNAATYSAVSRPLMEVTQQFPHLAREVENYAREKWNAAAIATSDKYNYTHSVFRDKPLPTFPMTHQWSSDVDVRSTYPTTQRLNASNVTPSRRVNVHSRNISSSLTPKNRFTQVEGTRLALQDMPDVKEGMTSTILSHGTTTPTSTTHSGQKLHTTCRFVAQFGMFLNQPRVVFEKIGGILIGPSVFSQNPVFANELFPESSWNFILFASGIGIQMYMLVIGLNLNIADVNTSSRRAMFIGFFSIMVPFALGMLIGPLLFNTMQSTFDSPRNSVKSFSFFIGISMSITAFPMLSRTMRETGLIATKIGSTTVVAAALNDCIAWLLLICAVALANSNSAKTTGFMFMAIVLYALILLTVVKHLFKRLVTEIENRFVDTSVDHHLFALVLAGTALSSWICTMLGISALIGAFLVGLVVPRDSRVHAKCLFNMEDFVLTHLMPLYFALSGLRTDFTSLNFKTDFPLVILICVLATFGKILGAGVPAILCGFKARESAVIAALMNTRGLVELIALNMGRQAGILNTRVFSVLVIMCLFTSFIAFPIVQCIYPEFKSHRAKENNSTFSDSRKRNWGGVDGNLRSEVDSDIEGIEMTDMIDMSGNNEEVVITHFVDDMWRSDVDSDECKDGSYCRVQDI